MFVDDEKEVAEKISPPPLGELKAKALPPWTSGSLTITALPTGFHWLRAPWKSSENKVAAEAVLATPTEQTRLAAKHQFLQLIFFMV